MRYAWKDFALKTKKAKLGGVKKVCPVESYTINDISVRMFNYRHANFILDDKDGKFHIIRFVMICDY